VETPSLAAVWILTQSRINPEIPAKTPPRSEHNRAVRPRLQRAAIAFSSESRAYGRRSGSFSSNHEQRQQSLPSLGVARLENRAVRFERLTGTGTYQAFTSVVDNVSGDAVYNGGLWPLQAMKYLVTS
jgi:hypothetical protein